MAIVPESPVKTKIDADAPHPLAFNDDGYLLSQPNVRTIQGSFYEAPGVRYAIFAQRNQTGGFLPPRGVDEQDLPALVLESLIGYSNATQAGMITIIEVSQYHCSGVFTTAPPPVGKYNVLAQFPVGPGATFSLDTHIHNQNNGIVYFDPDSSIPTRSFGLAVVFTSADATNGICFTSLVSPVYPA